MKKIIAMLLVLSMVLAFAGCAGSKAMTHEQYMAAEMQSEVVVETYVQAHQSWWDNKITVYCQSPGMTVEAIEFKNGEPGDDIYVTVSKDGASYSFCVELYLTGPDTEVYQAVSALVAGDVVDIEGFLYWYEGVNTHITAVTPAA